MRFITIMAISVLAANFIADSKGRGISAPLPAGDPQQENLSDLTPLLDSASRNATYATRTISHEVKISIFNPQSRLVIMDCQPCSDSTPFPSSSPVIGFRRFPPPDRVWEQTFVVLKRGNSDNYVLAFDRVENGEFKVLTEIENESSGGIEVWSKLFKEDSFPDNNVWRILPTTDSAQNEGYRIVSSATRRALTMTNRGVMIGQGQQFSALEMREIDENDEGQFWVLLRH